VADEYLVRWLDGASVAQDLGITAAPDGDHRLSVRPFGAVDVSEYTASAVAINSTYTLLSIVLGEPMYLIGLSGAGDTDGKWEFLVNGSVKARGMTRAAVPVWEQSFQGRHLYIPSGATISATVKNTGVIASNYQLLLSKEI
jgi:hypothetical protein